MDHSQITLTPASNYEPQNFWGSKGPLQTWDGNGIRNPLSLRISKKSPIASDSLYFFRFFYFYFFMKSILGPSKTVFLDLDWGGIEKITIEQFDSLHRLWNVVYQLPIDCSCLETIVFNYDWESPKSPSTHFQKGKNYLVKISYSIELYLNIKVVLGELHQEFDYFAFQLIPAEKCLIEMQWSLIIERFGWHNG